MSSQTIVVTGLSNREFLKRHARPGRVGLYGGTTKVDIAIRRAQRHLHEAGRWSDWSHAFLFEGTRADGQHWVMESDIQILKKNIQLGAQENRAAKYHDEKMFPALAVLDFGLNEAQVKTLLQEGLELVANRERYSLRELVGTLIALHKPELRAQENLLARERSVYCSAFVQRLFLKLGIDLVPGVTGKNTTPEDLARTPVPHTAYVLQPEAAPKIFSRARTKLRRQVSAGIQKIKHRALLLSLLLLAPLALAADAGLVAAKPLYRDPVYDGAADPTLIWNPQVQRWWMFYTDRRANVPGLSGVSWVHGTPIGIAESADGGAHWKFTGMAQIELPAEYGGTNVTEWAPDVIRAPDGTWQMFLTVVPGIFEDWNHPRFIVQLTSTNLLNWSNPKKLSLASDRVIDPSILRMPDGTWRLWYNDERTGKSIHYADSPDLAHWTDQGLAFKSRGEGPKGFRWHGKFWVIIDEWKGLGVFRSDDASNWSKQPLNLVAVPGNGPDDHDIGRHCDVVISDDRAFLFYFTHPGLNGNGDAHEHHRSSIQVAELREKDGWLTCDRDQPTHILLLPPK